MGHPSVSFWKPPNRAEYRGIARKQTPEGVPIYKEHKDALAYLSASLWTRTN